MSEPEPDRNERSGVLHGTAAPLDDALRSELYAAIEAIYAAGGSDTSPHGNAPKPEGRPHPAAPNRDATHAPSRSTPNAPLEAACERFSECLEFWESRIQARNLRQQRAIYHLHPPGNNREFESWVMLNSMSTTDAAVVARLRCMCPKVGFEVLPVVLEYTGTTCQFNAWVPRQQPHSHNAHVQIGEDGHWKTYQHVRHSPRVYQFKNFSGTAFAEEMAFKEGNVLDGRNVAWERARRDIFGWQTPHEQRAFEEERRVREANPSWYQNIVPGTSVELGKYFAPAILIVPLSTQLELVDVAEVKLPVVNIWQYLLDQCEESQEPTRYFTALKDLCYFALPGVDDAAEEAQILGMRVRNRDREEWADAIHPRLMGDLIMASLVFKDDPLFKHLATHAKVRPAINFTWLCQDASLYEYDATDAFNTLHRFLFEDSEFLQIANAIDKLPVCSANSEGARITVELVKTAVETSLKAPLSASHGRAVANFLKFFEDFQSWSDMVNNSAIGSSPHELWKHNLFTLGLLNRLLEVTKRDKLPLDKVKAFYRKYEKLIMSPQLQAPISYLVSNAMKDSSLEAKEARETWGVAEPTREYFEDKRLPPPTSFAVIAGLFRSLDRLEMHEESANLAEHIVKHKDEIEPIHMAPLWLPCLRILQDLADPENPAYQTLFQAIFELYERMVFQDISTRLEQDPESIPPMAPCCNHCRTLDSFFEQPKWKKLHLVKPKTVVDHVQRQLQNQKKPIEIHIYGKNEMSLTMQLTKVSLVNKKLLKFGEMRKQEAIRAVRQFEPVRLLPFFGDKGHVMWKLGQTEAPDAHDGKRPAKPMNSPKTPSTSGSGLCRTSSSSTSSSLDSSATPRRELRDPLAKSESVSSIDSAADRITPKTETPGGLRTVKAEPSAASSSTKYPTSGSKDIRSMFSSVKKEKTLGNSQRITKNTSTSARDRLKGIGSAMGESTSKFNDYSHTSKEKHLDRLRATPSKVPSSAVTSEASKSSSKASLELPIKRDPLGPFGGIRSRGPVRTGRQVGPAKDSKPAMRGFGLASRVNATPGPSSTPKSDSLSGPDASRPGTLPSNSSGPPRSMKGPDFMSAVLEVEKARKKRPTGSTWEVRTASGGVVSSGKSSSAAGKSRFDGLAWDKENPTRVGLSKPSFGPSRVNSSVGVLASRSPNVRLDNRASTSAGTKRKADDDIIDLCSSSPERGANKRKKSAGVSNSLDDDDPFAD